MSIRLIIALLILCLMPDAKAENVVGIHTVSIHLPQKQQSNTNPGLYIRHDSGATAGCYFNSIRRTSCYVGGSVEWGPFGLTLGGVTGYAKKHGGHSGSPISPFFAASVRGPEVFGVRPRVAYVPGRAVKSSDVFSLMIEKGF